MEPAHIRFGGGAAESVMHPIVICLLIIAVVLIFALPRRKVIIPVIATVFAIPLSQVLVLGGLHLTVVRIIIVFGILRWCTSTSRSLPWGFTTMDAVFLFWALADALAFCLLYMNSQVFINRAAFLVDSLGAYFLLRYLLRDQKDVLVLIATFASITALMAVLMMNEQLTHRNVYEYLGGIGSGTEIRAAHVRSQGVFQHSLLAGAFGSTCLPLFAALLGDRKYRTIALVGLLSATIMTVTTSGSTPYMIYAAGVFGLALWPLRTWMRPLRWGIVITLLGLHIVMKAPVWALIQRIDLTGSSSSYHRYLLVDSMFTHFGDWWIVGTQNYDTWGPDVWDLSNQFVAYAFRGGLATLVSFILLIVLGFRWVGIARVQANDAHSKWIAWCAGTALFAHVTAFFGVNYFDQTAVAWYALLALIVAIHQQTGATERAAAYQLARFIRNEDPSWPIPMAKLSRRAAQAPSTSTSPIRLHVRKESI